MTARGLAEISTRAPKQENDAVIPYYCRVSGTTLF